MRRSSLEPEVDGQEQQKQRGCGALNDSPAAHPRRRGRQDETCAEHGYAAPAGDDQPGPGMPCQCQRESRERADREKQVVEPLIEREQARDLGVLLGLTKPSAHRRRGPPQAFHTENHHVHRSGEQGADPHQDRHGIPPCYWMGTAALSVDTPRSSKLSMATQYSCPTVSARSSSVVPWSAKRW